MRLKWLQEDRIESISFFPTPMVDIGIDSTIWTRQLIQEVQDLELSVSGSFEVALERDTV